VRTGPQWASTSSRPGSTSGTEIGVENEPSVPAVVSPTCSPSISRVTVAPGSQPVPVAFTSPPGATDGLSRARARNSTGAARLGDVVVGAIVVVVDVVVVVGAVVVVATVVGGAVVAAFAVVVVAFAVVVVGCAVVVVGLAVVVVATVVVVDAVVVVAIVVVVVDVVVVVVVVVGPITVKVALPTWLVPFLRSVQYDVTL
jgi:hypothetical protein